MCDYAIVFCLSVCAYESLAGLKNARQRQWIFWEACVCWVFELDRARSVCIIENRRWSNDDDDVNRWPKSWNKMLSNERPWRLCYYDFAAAAAATATQPPSPSTILFAQNWNSCKFSFCLFIFIVFFSFRIGKTKHESWTMCSIAHISCTPGAGPPFASMNWRAGVPLWESSI